MNGEVNIMFIKIVASLLFSALSFFFATVSYAMYVYSHNDYIDVFLIIAIILCIILGIGFGVCFISGLMKFLEVI